MEYIAYLHKDRKSDFGVSFPDFPGCVTAGKTLDEARLLASEALAFHIEGMIEDGEAIPEPLPLDALAKDPAMKSAVALLVSVDAGGRVRRFNITARRSQMEEIDRLATKCGMTRSAFMVASSLADKGRRAQSRGNSFVPTGSRRRSSRV
jgi:predicted RNase H-like HicB family nuclease